jgi:prepilin peptidase CpaA
MFSFFRWCRRFRSSMGVYPEKPGKYFIFRLVTPLSGGAEIYCEKPVCIKLWRAGDDCMFLLVNNYILLTLLLLALYFDLTQKKIPNFLTFPVILWGLVSNTITGGGGGFLFSFYGLLLGTALFFIPFVMGGMGGGDVKLLGAIGAMKGAQFVLQAALFTVLCGGVLAIGYLLVHRQLGSTLKKIFGVIAVPLFNALYYRYGYPFFNRLSFYFSSFKEEDPGKKVYLPYGVAIVLGTLIVLSNLGERILPLANIFCK